MKLLGIEISLDLLIELALSVVCLLISFIFGMVLKKKSSKSSALLFLRESLPILVLFANQLLGSKTGSAKLQLVLSLISQYCNEYNLNYDPEYYSGEIEKILMADKAKEVSNETAQNATQKGQSVFQFHCQPDEKFER